MSSFLRNEPCTHLMLIDDDMGWDPLDVIRLVGHEKDFVAAAGPKKQGGGPAFAFTAKRGAGTDPNGLLEVEEVGAAFTLLTRAACDRIMQGYPETEFSDGSHFQKERAIYDPIFVDGSQFGRRRLWEDYAFCYLWKNLGGQIFIDVTVKLSHKGSHTWKGAAQDIMGLPTSLPFAREMRDGAAPVPDEASALAIDSRIQAVGRTVEAAEGEVLFLNERDEALVNARGAQMVLHPPTRAAE